MPADRARVDRLSEGLPDEAHAHAEALVRQAANPTGGLCYAAFVELAMLCFRLSGDRKRRWGLSSEGFKCLLLGAINYLHVYQTQIEKLCARTSNANEARRHFPRASA
mmetsp:Transcript_36246/g.90478  ORF Transcript_36246/g.90478 Transcript_36246/m.90478 type:complete len:108 (+) Transcript_36246:354-677(+)